MYQLLTQLLQTKHTKPHTDIGWNDLTKEEKMGLLLLIEKTVTAKITQEKQIQIQYTDYLDFQHIHKLNSLSNSELTEFFKLSSLRYRMANTGTNN